MYPAKRIEDDYNDNRPKSEAHARAEVGQFLAEPLEQLYTPSAWLYGYSVALILRDLAAADALCRSAQATFSSDGQATFHTHMALALCARQTGEDATTELTSAYFAMKAADLDQQRRMQPTWNMLKAIYRNQAKAFNDALFIALNLHYEGSEGAVWGSAGHLAIVPLGLCCLAREEGIHVEVQSAAIPHWLFA